MATLTTGGLNEVSSILNSVSPNPSVQQFLSNVDNVLGGAVDTLTQGAAAVDWLLGSDLSSLVGGNLTGSSPILNLGKQAAKTNLLREMGSRPDPVTNFDWIAMVVNNGGDTQKGTIPWAYINEINLPSVEIGVSERYVNGRNRRYADSYDAKDVSMRIYADVAGRGFKFARDWTRTVYREDNLYSLPSVYKKSVHAFILDPTRRVVIYFSMLNVFPTNWESYQLVSSNGDALVTRLTCSIDDFRINYDPDPASVAENVNTILAGAANISQAVSNVGGVVSGAIQTVSGIANAAAGTAGAINSVLNIL